MISQFQEHGSSERELLVGFYDLRRFEAWCRDKRPTDILHLMTGFLSSRGHCR